MQTVSLPIVLLSENMVLWRVNVPVSLTILAVPEQFPDDTHRGHW
jgi:hypothetical protein